MVIDDNWKEDKFHIAAGSNNFTLDYLSSGDSYDHKCALAPPGPLLIPVRFNRASCAADASAVAGRLLWCAGLSSSR
jgi:protein involved in ribonucleotide reduction